jgi:hypothetical protein
VLVAPLAAPLDEEPVAVDVEAAVDGPLEPHAASTAAPLAPASKVRALRRLTPADGSLTDSLPRSLSMRSMLPFSSLFHPRTDCENPVKPEPRVRANLGP